MFKRFNPRGASRQRRPGPRRGAKFTYRRPLRFEPLEDRRVLAVLTVTTPLDIIDFDDGLLSLREAIFAANTVPGHHTIEFDFGHDGPETIVLTMGELRITDSLTIQGTGPDLLTIDASGSDPTPDVIDGLGSRVFNIDDGSATTQIDVTIAGLTLTGGDVNGNGGAILSAENLLLTDLVIENNVTHASRGEGGGVYATGPLVIEHSRISDNSASGRSPRGGGVLGLDTIAIHHSEITGNTASRGGGIYSTGTEIVIADTTIASNQGGGLATFGSGSVLVARSTVEGNVLTEGGGGGVSLWLTSGGTAKVTETVISSNSSTTPFAAGGLSIHADLNSRVILENTTISGNQANRQGGGVIASLNRGSLLEIIDSTISENIAETTGGGLHLGVHNNSSVLVQGTTIHGNTAATGGGGGIMAMLSSGGSATFEQVTISGNTTGGAGGGILINSSSVDSGPVIIRHSTIFNNNGDNASGGLRATSATRLSLDHTIVAGNFLTGGIAADLYVASWQDSQIRYSLVGTNSGSRLAEAPVGLPDADGNLIGGPVHGVIDPLLGPLADNGGPTLTHALLPGSPAINAGNLNLMAGVDGVPLYDQRGEPFSRVVGGRIDIGAFEYQFPSDLNLLVDTLDDIVDGDYSRGNLSLREAILLANMWPGHDTVRFDPALAGGTILLTQGELRITDHVAIIGLGPELLTIDASGSDPTPDVKDGLGTRIFNIPHAPSGPLNIVISGLTLTGGDAPSAGGAIFSFGSSLTISDARIVDNAARGEGGGIFVNNGDLVVHESTISNNTTLVTHLGPGGFGGGVYFLASLGFVSHHLEVRRSTISDNTAWGGGGVWARIANGSVTIEDSTISGNAGVVPGDLIPGLRPEAGRGGGVYANIQNGTATISHSTIQDNSAEHGGGVSLALLNGTASLLTSAIEGNSATGDGGGIHHDRNRLNVVNSSISGNTAVGSGGGIYASGGRGLNLSVSQSDIVGNSAGLDGGGISSLVWAEIRDTTVSGNVAGRDGGGLSHGALGSTIVSSTFNDNSAGRNGGGLAAGFRAALTNSTVSGNSAGALGGGIWSQSDATLAHSTITANHADVAGGGAFATRGSLRLTHTIIAANTARAGRDLSGLLGATFDAQFSLIGSNADSGLAASPAGSPDANGNLIGGPLIIGVPPIGPINPLLGPLADNGGPTMTHALLPGSPAINAGDPAAQAGVAGVPLHDQRGAPFTRVFDGRIDIGAFEVQPAVILFDAAAYTRWRDTLGTHVSPGTAGDVNADGQVDYADYLVWKSNFGRMAADSAATSAPLIAALAADDAGDAPGSVLRASHRPPASPPPRAEFTPTPSRAPESRPADAAFAHLVATHTDAALVAWLTTRGVNRDVQAGLTPELTPSRSQPAHDASTESSELFTIAMDRVFESIGMRRT